MVPRLIRRPEGLVISVVDCTWRCALFTLVAVLDASGFGPQSNTLLDRITLPDGFLQIYLQPTTTDVYIARIASVKSLQEGRFV